MKSCFKECEFANSQSKISCSGKRQNGPLCSSTFSRAARNPRISSISDCFVDSFDVSRMPIVSAVLIKPATRCAFSAFWNKASNPIRVLQIEIDDTDILFVGAFLLRSQFFVGKSKITSKFLKISFLGTSLWVWWLRFLLSRICKMEGIFSVVFNKVTQFEH